MYRKAMFLDCTAIYNLICDLEKTQLSFDRFSAIFHRQLEDSHYYCLVCEQEEQVCGILNLRFEEQLHHAECIAEILEFVIDSDYRSRGIGKEMLAAACRIAKENDCTQIEVACNRLRRDSHRFYEREGMHDFHFKFSKNLIGQDTVENRLGK